ALPGVSASALPQPARDGGTGERRRHAGGGGVAWAHPSPPASGAAPGVGLPPAHLGGLRPISGRSARQRRRAPPTVADVAATAHRPDRPVPAAACRVGRSPGGAPPL